MAKVLSFFSQKGGVGKSTLTTLMACYLSAQGKRVVVIDGDSPQHSIYTFRSSNLKTLERNEFFKEAFEKLGTEAFELHKVDITQLDEAVDFHKSRDVDYVFVDLPGTLNLNSSTFIYLLDVVILPIEVERMVYVSSVNTLTALRALMPELPTTFIWNSHNPAAKVYESTKPALEQEMKNKFGNNFFKTQFSNLVSMKRDVNTFVPPSDKRIINSVISLSDEMTQKGYL